MDLVTDRPLPVETTRGRRFGKERLKDEGVVPDETISLRSLEPSETPLVPKRGIAPRSFSLQTRDL